MSYEDDFTPPAPAAGEDLPLLETYEMLCLLLPKTSPLTIHGAVTDAESTLDHTTSWSDAFDAAARAAERLQLNGDLNVESLDAAIQTAKSVGPVATLAGTGDWIVLRGGDHDTIQLAAPMLDVHVPRKRVEDILAKMFGAEAPQWFAVRKVRTSAAAPAAGHEALERRSHATKSSHHHDGSHDHHHHGPSPLKRLYLLLKPERNDIAVVAVFAAVIGLLSLATPIAVESLVNTIAFGRLVQPIIVICGMLLVILGFAAVLRLLQTWVAEVMQRRIFVRVVADLAWRLPRAEQTAFDRQSGPELMNRFFDVMTVQKSAALLVLDGIAIVMQVAIGMCVLAFYHPILLGFDLLLVATMAGMIWILGRGAVGTAIEESKAKYSVAAWLEDLVRSPAMYKSSRGAKYAALVADRLAVDYVSARQRHFRILIRQIGFAVALQALAGSILFGIGGWLVISGQLTLGQLVAAELIVSVVVGSFAKLGKQMEGYYDLMAAVDKLGHLFDLPVETQRGERPAFAARAPALRLNGVSYRYPGDEPGLAAVSLEIPASEVTAIFGPTGCGKSTLIDLLYALRKPSTGHIDIGEIDLREIRPAEYRDYAILVRDVAISGGSIREFLTAETSGVDSEYLHSVLTGLGLADDLKRFSAGLQTELQVGGAPLSETQGRLLMLARAIVAKPRILLIDGLLDGLTDDTLPKAMRYLRNQRAHTTIVIATGREAVADGCDRIVRPRDPHARHQPIAKTNDLFEGEESLHADA